MIIEKCSKITAICLLNIFGLKVVVDAVHDPAKHPPVQGLCQTVSTIIGQRNTPATYDLLSCEKKNKSCTCSIWSSHK